MKFHIEQLSILLTINYFIYFYVCFNLLINKRWKKANFIVIIMIFLLVYQSEYLHKDISFYDFFSALWFYHYTIFSQIIKQKIKNQKTHYFNNLVFLSKVFLENIFMLHCWNKSSYLFRERTILFTLKYNIFYLFFISIYVLIK